MSFAALPLVEPLQRAIAEAGWSQPTSIQRLAIPALLDGRSALVQASTGSGKTAAFLIPVLQRIALPTRRPGLAGLVVTPTRELAEQIATVARQLGRHLGITPVLLVAGAGQAVIDQIVSDSLVIATPGRLLDALSAGAIQTDACRVVVIDEVDRLLDDGFAHQTEAVLTSLPEAVQRVGASATVNAAVQALLPDCGTIGGPERGVAVELPTGLQVRGFSVARRHKGPLLHHLLLNRPVKRCLVFCRSRRGVERLASRLDRERLGVQALHGEMTPAQRRTVMGRVRGGRIRILVSTDLAARGIDLPELTHVVQRDLPDTHATFVHRIGRTARAGATGHAWALVDAAERHLWHAYAASSGWDVALDDQHPFASSARDEWDLVKDTPADQRAGVLNQKTTSSSNKGRRTS